MDEQIGHYRIVRELGRGAMGVVYLAHEDSLNRTVALKVLAPNLTETEEDFQRFHLEAKSLARLNHRNIVQIYFVGEDAGRHFFAMEYVPSSLQQMLRAEGRLESSRAAQLVLNAATGLAAAHERDIVHRDVKPANLLVAEDGTLKVADFGIARMAAASTRLTAADAILGTPRYISPEQCEGADGDPRSDIYSLGVTYYEMLTGQAPYRSTSALALVREILQDTPPPIEEVMPEVDDRTRTIVGKMMTKDPAGRYQSARELAADLQAHLLSRVMPDWDGRGSFPAAAAAPAAAAPAAAAPAATVTVAPEPAANVTVAPEPAAASAAAPEAVTEPFTTPASLSPPPAPASVPPPALEAIGGSGSLKASPGGHTVASGAGAAPHRSAVAPWALAVLAILLLTGAGTAVALWQNGAARQAVASAVGAVAGLFAGEDTDEPRQAAALPAAATDGAEQADRPAAPADGAGPAEPASASADATAVEPAGRPRSAADGPETVEWTPPSASAAPTPAAEPAGATRPGAKSRDPEPTTAKLASLQSAAAARGVAAAGPSRSAAVAPREPRRGTAVRPAAPPRGVALAVWSNEPLIAGALEDYLTNHLLSQVELVTGPTLAEALVEGQPPPGQFLLEARDRGARHVILVTATFQSEQMLHFHGHQELSYQSRITLESVDTGSREQLTRWSDTVQYTAIQTERFLEEALAEPLAELIAALRH